MRRLIAARCANVSRGYPTLAVVAMVGVSIVGCAVTPAGMTPTPSADSTPSTLPSATATHEPSMTIPPAIAKASDRPSPQPVRFTSARYGYTMLLPDREWSIYETPGSWSPGTAVSETGPGVDVVTRSGTVVSPIVALTAQPVPPETIFDEWAATHDQAVAAAFPFCELVSTRSGEIDGVQARFAFYSCGSRSPIEATAIHNGRAYWIRIIGPVSPTFNPLRTLEDWLARFEFTAVTE